MIHEHGMAAAISRLLQGLTAGLLQIEIPGHFLDHFGRYSSAVTNEGRNQRMLAEQIRNSRYAPSMAVYGFDRFRTENFCTGAAGDAQTLPYISVCLQQR